MTLRDESNIWKLFIGFILSVLTMNDYVSTHRIFLTPQTANAHIIKENQTVNKELKEQQEKVGQLLVENSKHTMISMQHRREIEMSAMREGLLKERVDKLNEENVNLRHFAERNSKNTSLGNLLKAGSSTNSLVSSLSGVFGGDSMGNLSKRSSSQFGSQSGLGNAHSKRSASANQMIRANSYGLKRSTSAAVVGNSSFLGNAASRSSFGHNSAPAPGRGGNASWDLAGPAAPMGGMGGSGANMFLSILEGEAM